ncbi:MAG: VanZ family protein [Verrucomicrobiaceae bacterium]|nr:VanZ family protein [Verrucomicrobiaceae bacterium]
MMPRFLQQPLFWRSAVLVWIGVLYWLSAQSTLPSPPGVQGIDKIEHAGYFTLGGFCFLMGLRLAGKAQRKWLALLLTVLFCSFVGIWDEWHQLHVPGRSGGDVGDWFADTLGGLFGTLAVLAVEKYFRRRVSAG